MLTLDCSFKFLLCTCSHSSSCVDVRVADTRALETEKTRSSDAQPRNKKCNTRPNAGQYILWVRRTKKASKKNESELEAAGRGRTTKSAFKICAEICCETFRTTATGDDRYCTTRVETAENLAPRACKKEEQKEKKEGSFLILLQTVVGS